jgi:phosphoglycolate phosphatase
MEEMPVNQYDAIVKSTVTIDCHHGGFPSSRRTGMSNARTLVAGARAVVFDLDGTLVDTFDDLALALDSALHEFGLPPAPRDAVLADIHRGLDDTARAILRLQGGDPALQDAVVAAYRHHYRQRAHAASRLYPGVRELLAACRQREQAMAVCTNKLAADARESLEQLDIADYFANVIGIDSCGAAKPDPAPLWHTLDYLECLSDSAVFIGDSEIDAACAKTAAVPFLLHEAGFGAEAARGVGYSACFGTYEELVG